MEKALDTQDVVVENDLKTQTLAEDEQRFEDNLQKFRTAVAGNEGKYNLIIAAQQGKVLRQLNVALDKVVGKQGESDFQIINLIRLLFLGDDKFPDIATAKTQVTKALSGFPFWPVKNKKKQPDFDKIVFWSENHLFMTLGSCYLFRQYDLNPEAKTAAPETQAIILQELNKKLETKLLKIYLRAHCLTEFNGLYEANSTVYLPYSLSGLLNLYDFSIDEEVKELAHKIIDRLIYHVMLCTTSNGVSNLCAGGRTFVRTRTRVVNHNMNQVTNLILGKSPDDMNPSAVTDYILTTSWRPNYSEVKEALIFTGTHPPLRMSHPYTSTRELYTNLAGAEEVPLCEITPLFWSAGLVTHPEFVVETRNYLHAKGMQSNHHLSALCYLPTWFVHRQMLHYATVSKGQMYTDIELNVFKHPEQNLLLSSFEKFNPHCSSFQQLPWMANIAGLGVWAQAGSGSEGIMNFGISNTHNPLITQKGSVLIASYISPSTLMNAFVMGSVFKCSVRLYWPVGAFTNWCCFNAPSDDTWRSNISPTASNPMVMHNTLSKLDEVVQKPGSWCAGQHENSFIAVYCSQKSRMDHSQTKDVHYPRRICDQYRHSWVVIVGSTKDYASLQNFIDVRCLSMVIREQCGGSGRVGSRAKYEFEVIDEVEGVLNNTVSLPV